MASNVPSHLLILATACVGAAALAGCKAEATSPAGARPQTVETVTVTFEPAVQTWSYVGTVKPRYQSDLGFRVAGKITARLVEVGGVVKKGDVIAQLDPTDFDLTLAAQEAEAAAAKTNRDEAIAALERFRLLFNDGHIAQAALDQRVSAAAEAKSRVERAERNVDLARNQLTYTNLVSDSDGVVVAIPIEEGQVVTPGQLVARVARRDALEVEVALPEQDVEAARTATGEVDVWGGGSSRFPVTLREVAPDADPVSRTYRARFSLHGAGGALDLGRTATVHLQAREQQSVAALPLAAISNDGPAPVAWVVSEDGTRATPRPVTIRALEKDRALVSSGVRAGDRVVAFGVHMLDLQKAIRPIESRGALQPKITET